MIHISLIDYKKLYEETLHKLEENKFLIENQKADIAALKELHNKDVEHVSEITRNICDLKVEHLENDERLCDLLGGEGSLEDRILNAKELISHQNSALEYAREQIVSKDARIAELMKDGITDKDEALMELHQSYQRLQDDYYSISELYDNAQKTIDRLCSNE